MPKCANNGLKNVVLQIDPEVHRLLKVHAAYYGTSLTHLVSDALREYVERHEVKYPAA